MNNNKQQRLDKLTAEYNDLNGKISRLDAFLNRLDFETIVPDGEEQMLMQHQLNAMRSYRTNLKERIQLLQVQIQAGSPCDDRVVTSATHHCGQDASCQVGDGSAVVDKPIITGESLEQLVGAIVRLFHKPGHKCIDCPYRSKSYGGKCVYKKVELVGGYYLCLADLPNSIVTE